MHDSLNLDPLAGEHRRVWWAARLLFLLIPYPFILVLFVQTWNPVVDNLTFHLGPFVLAGAFVVAFNAAGRLVGSAGPRIATAFAGYLVVNAVVLYDKFLPSIRDGTAFVRGDVVTTIAYFASLVMIVVGARAALRLHALVVPRRGILLRDVLADVQRLSRRPGLGVRARARLNGAGVALFALSTALLGASVWLFVLDYGVPMLSLERRLSGDVHRLIAILGFVTLSLPGIVLGRLALRYVRRDAHTHVADDARQPVLILRSFSDDRATLKPVDLLARLQWRRIRLEEVLARETQVLGPAVAIGAPDERLPPLGAHRAYYGEGAWQPAVRRWMTESRAIALIAGLTPWVAWELREIVKLGQLHKLVVLLPSGSGPERQRRWEHLQECLRETPWQPALNRVSGTDLIALCFVGHGQVVCFDSVARTECEYVLAMRLALHEMLVARTWPRPFPTT